MGALALAGMAAGAGNALQQGLFNMQEAFIRRGLLHENDDMEQRRRQLTFANDRAMQQERLAHDTEQTAIKEAGAERRHQADLQHREMMTGQEIGSREAIADREIGSREGLAAREISSREWLSGQDREMKQGLQKEDLAYKREKDLRDNTTANRRIAADEQHNKDWKEVHTPTDPSSKHYRRQAETYAHFLEEYVKAMRDEYKDPLTTPARREELQGEMRAYDEDVRDVLGIPPREKRPARRGIIDPFATISKSDPFKGQSTLSKPADSSKDADAALVRPAQTYDQRVEEQLKDPPFERFLRWRRSLPSQPRPYPIPAPPTLPVQQ